jgi:endonuclease YncB( thermonuclease family)
VRVIDGDSLIAEVTRDLGFNGKATFTQRLRLNRINCPRLFTEAGVAAKDATTQLVTGGSLDITTVKAYKYGDTWMAEIVLPDGRNVSDELVATGHAVYWSGQGARPGG